MKPSEILNQNRTKIRQIFATYPKLQNLRVFGSVARGEDTENSDIDFLVTVLPGSSLFDIGGLCTDLQDVFGDNFDLMEESSLPLKFKENVLKEAVVV
ncbi:nucleotidyltransferase family protein [Lonepinella sp. BR2271]|uniref:nucleotidyltransferase family protein n=1 Tax=Lonepinella sp. BR2271 TaxID=3434550 RepID=UPI003F6E341A